MGLLRTCEVPPPEEDALVFVFDGGSKTLVGHILLPGARYLEDHDAARRFLRRRFLAASKGSASRNIQIDLIEHPYSVGSLDIYSLDTVHARGKSACFLPRALPAIGQRIAVSFAHRALSQNEGTGRSILAVEEPGQCSKCRHIGDTFVAEGLSDYGELCGKCAANYPLQNLRPVGLNAWRDKIHELARKKGWHDPAHPSPLGERLMLVVGELSEAMEELRDGRGPTEVYYNPPAHADALPKPEGFPIELVDAIIRLFDLSGQLGIDLEKLIREKHEYNKTRPYRHNKAL